MVRKSSSPLSNIPIVVKIGGSLYDHIPGLVPALLAPGRPLLIVPGGGKFADFVRSTPADDESAHWMAIAAMDQYGWYIASQGIPIIDIPQVPDRPTVFLPYCSMRKHDPVPHSWDVTSDSIAAWVAGLLGLDLLLLKSVDGLIEGGNLISRVNNPVKTETVDPAFLPYIMKNKIPTTVINGSRIGRVEKFLRGEVVPGTRIGTTF